MEAVLPVDLFDHVAGAAFARGTRFAFASRSTMDASMRALGVNSIVAVCMRVALRDIERALRTDEQRFASRLLFVTRALGAGIRADVLVWPAESVDGPRPTPLREHKGPRGVAHSVPLEHNMHVSLDEPTDTEHCMRLGNLALFGEDGRHWRDERLVCGAYCDPVQTMHLNYLAEIVPENYNGLKHISLHGSTQTASNVAAYNREPMFAGALDHQCMRRMVIKLSVPGAPMRNEALFNNFVHLKWYDQTRYTPLDRYQWRVAQRPDHPGNKHAKRIIELCASFPLWLEQAVLQC